MVDVKLFDVPKLKEEVKEKSTGRNKLEGKLELLNDINIELTTSIGRCELTIAQLANYKIGEVLPLDKQVDEQVDIYLGKNRIARGSLVVAGDYFGVKIEEIAAIITE